MGGVNAVRVRGAVHADIPWIIEELYQFSKLFGSRYPLFAKGDGNEEYATQSLRHIIDHHVCLLAESPGGNEMGFIAGYDLGHPFNPNIRTLSEQFWWVSQIHRGSSAGAKLFHAFNRRGEENMVKWITMALEANSPVNPDALLKRGYRLQETSYLREIE